MATAIALAAGAVAGEAITTFLLPITVGRLCLSRCGRSDPRVAARPKPARAGRADEPHVGGHRTDGASNFHRMTAWGADAGLRSFVDDGLWAGATQQWIHILSTVSHRFLHSRFR